MQESIILNNYSFLLRVWISQMEQGTGQGWKIRQNFMLSSHGIQVRQFPGTSGYSFTNQEPPMSFCVMVNCKYQLDWATSCLDIWLTIISGCVCEVVLSEVTI